MSANRERAKVHMLPTEQSLMCKTNDKLYFYPQENWFTRSTDTDPQHLYVTTDEEIKEGDWYYSSLNCILKATSSMLPIFGGRKIIASTDPKLTQDFVVIDTLGSGNTTEQLPQPSQALIKAYCEQGGFDEVDVEYEYGFSLKLRRGGESHAYKLKVDPIHNTITTHRIVEKMYSRDEVESLLKELSNDIDGQFHHNFKTNNWIKENL